MPCRATSARALSLRSAEVTSKDLARSMAMAFPTRPAPSTMTFCMIQYVCVRSARSQYLQSFVATKDRKKRYLRICRRVHYDRSEPGRSESQNVILPPSAVEPCPRPHRSVQQASWISHCGDR